MTSLRRGLYAITDTDLLAGRLLDSAPVALEVEVRGELSTEDDLSVLGLSAVRGLFSAPTAEPASMPPVQPTVAKEAKVPRQRGGPFSARNTAEVMYSPPTESPCARRSTSSSTAESTPAVS